MVWCGFTGVTGSRGAAGREVGPSSAKGFYCHASEFGFYIIGDGSFGRFPGGKQSKCTSILHRRGGRGHRSWGREGPRLLVQGWWGRNWVGGLPHIRGVGTARKDEALSGDQGVMPKAGSQKTACQGTACRKRG